MLGVGVGRLLTGALWGVLAGLAVTLSGEGTAGLRSVARGIIKVYLAVSEDVRWKVAEARENVDDLRAEVRSERAAARTRVHAVGGTE